MNFIRIGFCKIRAAAIRITNQRRLISGSRYVKRLRNAHQGQRCFIVGNGPSLKTEDLERLQGEICFGTHRVYTIFGETDWRPTYYCAQDHTLIKNSAVEIDKFLPCKKFIATIKHWKYPKIHNAAYLPLNPEAFYPNLPRFSEDVSQCIFEGFTVSYMCLQLAAYMGFKEIYLLGIDHNYSKVKLPTGEILDNIGVQDHFSQTDTIENVPQLFKSVLAYEKAKEYAEHNGIKIYNATRGGRLEVFERVSFDSLF